MEVFRIFPISAELDRCVQLLFGGGLDGDPRERVDRATFDRPEPHGHVHAGRSVPLCARRHHDHHSLRFFAVNLRELRCAVAHDHSHGMGRRQLALGGLLHQPWLWRFLPFQNFSSFPA